MGRDARRVARIGHFVAVRSLKTDFLLRTAAGHIGDEEARPPEEADFGVARIADLRPGDPVEAAANDDVAPRPHFVVDDVVVEPVGENGFVARAKLDVAFGADALFAAFDSIGAQEQDAARLLRRRRWGARRRGLSGTR